MPSPSYSRTSRRPTRRTAPAPYDGNDSKHLWSTLMNTIIYIVGLVVVIAFILSFFGLR